MAPLASTIDTSGPNLAPPLAFSDYWSNRFTDRSALLEFEMKSCAVRGGVHTVSKALMGSRGCKSSSKGIEMRCFEFDFEFLALLA